MGLAERGGSMNTDDFVTLACAIAAALWLAVERLA